MQEGKTTNNYNDLLKFRIVKEMYTKCAIKPMHKSNKIWHIWHAIFSRQSPDGPWRTSVKTDSKEKSVAACMRMNRLVWEWSCFVDRKKECRSSWESVLSFFEGKGSHDLRGTLLFLPLDSHTGKENPPSGDFLFCLFFEKRKKS